MTPTLPLSSVLPLRRTSAWGTFAVDQALPDVFGRCRVTPVPADRYGYSFCLADHSIDGIESVTRDNAPYYAYKLEHKQDASGKVIAWLTLNDPLKTNEQLAAVIRGKRHPNTGALITNPASIVWDLLSTVCGLPVKESDFAGFYAQCATAGIELAGVVSDGKITIRTTLDSIMQSAGAVWSGSMPGFAKLYPGVDDPGAVAWRFDAGNCSNIKSTCSSARIATELRLAFAKDWHTGETTKTIIVAAPAAAARYGKTSIDVSADWITSTRQALLLATRLLEYRARVVWAVSWQAGLDCRHLLPGNQVYLTHPLAPVSGTCMLMSVETDQSAGTVTLQTEMHSEPRPLVELAGSAYAWEPVAIDGMTITYQNGMATFTIQDDQWKALAGASVTIDGGVTRVTDKAGKVQFAASRGKHHLLIQAAGYQSFDIEVTV